MASIKALNKGYYTMNKKEKQPFGNKLVLNFWSQNCQFVFETGFHSVIQDGLQLTVLPLSQAPKCWDCRHMPPYLAQLTFKIHNNLDLAMNNSVLPV